MTEQRDVIVWHNALGEPHADRIAQVVERMEARGWRLIERREEARQWLSFDTRGRTILKFER